MSNLFRMLPSVDIALSNLDDLPYAHSLLYDAITDFLTKKRESIKNGLCQEEELLPKQLIADMRTYVLTHAAPRVQAVINATGVVIHTNLGRSTLANEAIEAILLVADSYCNLEFDIETGERGSRHSLVEQDICRLTGAESALVVNNNAAAVLLMLNSLCENGETIVSRGQLVEIGGSFRIPDVMKKSGTHLCEVGTTNRCHAEDYINAIHENTQAILKVHTSNYRIIGFHSEVETKDLAKIAHDHNIPLLEDLGSGTFIDFSLYGLPGEPTVKDLLGAGVDVVTFSGDKVLGGPQAGIIAGKKYYIDLIKNNQLIRALRCDKLTLAALEATLRLYYNPEEALRKIPTLWRMTMPIEELLSMATQLSKRLKRALNKENVRTHLLKGNSRVGGGSFPEKDLPTYLVGIDPVNDYMSLQDLRLRLLQSTPPIVGRIEQNMFMLDVRTLDTEEFFLIEEILKSIFT